MKYSISPNNIHLISSFEIKKADFERELTALREEHPDCLVWNRSIGSLKLEWAAHNAFHALGILRPNTGDTDLNWPQKWFIRLGYAVAVTLAWPFIK
ncbi:MAG: hypothetical protein J6T22_14495 [Bacteroidales bacterium]|nr:hypothetical protein [Prevotella sp.]MBO7618392.1 hypothetical protein [Bacteroidales bacterium]